MTPLDAGIRREECLCCRGKGWVDVSIGSEIREVRERAGISLRGMARRLGYSPSYVSQVERGKFKISADWALRYQEIAKFFGRKP